MSVSSIIVLRTVHVHAQPTEKHADDADEDAEKAKFRVKVAVYASLIANLCLAGLQLYAATSSLSLSFFATAADSGECSILSLLGKGI